MIGIDFSAFVRMILLSLLLGTCLGGVLEIIRFVFSLCFHKTVDDLNLSSWFIRCVVAARDIVFFFVSGIAFSVLVYYTNNGNVRLFAILGTIAGFLAFYFTIGRCVRMVLELFVRFLHKLVWVLVCPMKRMIGKFLRWIKSKKHMTKSKKEIT